MVIRSRNVWQLFLTVSLLIASVPGCQPPEPSGVTASGTVSVGKQPLSAAVITLEPMRETTGPNASAAIFDGHFDFPPEAGLQGGSYRVRISLIPAELRRSLPPEQAAKAPPPEAVIAPKYDGESQLNCQLTPGEPNTLTFTVEFL